MESVSFRVCTTGLHSCTGQRPPNFYPESMSLNPHASLLSLFFLPLFFLSFLPFSCLLECIPESGQLLSDFVLRSSLLRDPETGAGPRGVSGVGDGAGGGDAAAMNEFGVDPNADPELYMALQLSLQEEQNRAARMQEQRQAEEGGGGAGGAPASQTDGAGSGGAPAGRKREEKNQERSGCEYGG